MSERDWTTRTPQPGDWLNLDGLRIAVCRRAGATLVSGDLDAAIAALSPGAPLLGLLSELPEGPCALRIARDRALLCTAVPLEAEGWHGSYAASAADDAFAHVLITGPRWRDVQAACLAAPDPSPSAATRFAGFGALVATLPGGGLSVRVEAPHAAALWAQLVRLAGVL